MAVFVIASSKGGVGKSTLALVLSQVLAHEGADTCLIDADPNNALGSWHRATNKLPENFSLVEETDDERVIDAIDAASDNHQFVVVDLEGSSNTTVSYAIGRADLVIIPFTGGRLDALEAVKVDRLVTVQEKNFRRKIPRVCIHSKTGYIKPRTVKEVCAQIKETGLPVLEAELWERDAYRALFSYGGTLWDFKTSEVSNPAEAIVNAVGVTSNILAFYKEVSNV